ncbi:uncharacterized protein LOC102498853 isoform X4 [Tupaia chinensis]|uniref:uncharacterized protein LOC102498853 isoform X4 n=1 Tax=Tupaia chinensis TaxID=246437 RepID=UPI0003C8C533|nr:uncharacterized protein LOC102498853 isoform X4 [Tupaia chinensis]
MRTADPKPARLRRNRAREEESRRATERPAPGPHAGILGRAPARSPPKELTQTSPQSSCLKEGPCADGSQALPGKPGPAGEGRAPGSSGLGFPEESSLGISVSDQACKPRSRTHRMGDPDSGSAGLPLPARPCPCRTRHRRRPSLPATHWARLSCCLLEPQDSTLLFSSPTTDPVVSDGQGCPPQGLLGRQKTEASFLPFRRGDSLAWLSSACIDGK